MNTLPAHRTTVRAALSRPWARLGRWLSALSAASAMLASPLSYAQTPPRDPTARAEWLSAEAEKAFKDKRFTEAIRLYLDAWEAAPSAGLLYNIAFIYDRRLSDPELAIQYYERAGRSEDADAALKGRVNKRMAELKAELAAARAKQPPARPTQPTQPSQPTQPTQPMQPAQPSLPVIRQGQNPLPSGGGSVGPWILLSAGGASLVGGVVMGFVAAGTHADFEDERQLDAKLALRDDGKTQALVADILMGVGAASLLGGLIWAVVDSGSSSSSSVGESTFRIEPMFVGQGAGIVIGGSL